MLFKKHLLILCLLFASIDICNAQIEVAHVTSKNFTSTGFGGFLNFAIPVAETNYITLEGGAQYFKNKYDEELVLVPVLVGYRYTLNQTGEGFYVEPFGGYTFGASTISTYDDNGGYTGGEEKVAGPAAGIGVGYLVDLGNIPFNFGLRYQHNFSNYATNVFSFRISHTFHIGRRSED